MVYVLLSTGIKIIVSDPDPVQSDLAHEILIIILTAFNLLWFVYCLS
jgi:hypothetical protein